MELRLRKHGVVIVTCVNVIENGFHLQEENKMCFIHYWKIETCPFFFVIEILFWYLSETTEK